MRNALIGLLSAFFLSLPGLALANAGYIHDMKGQTTLTTAAGATTPARIGSIVPAGSTVRTAAGSSAVVKFEDGQVMALHENTAFRITEYNYNKTNVSQSRAVFNLLQGGMRFITGVIGSTNNNAVRLTASTATIGIRGTDGILTLVQGIVTAAVNNGAIALVTPLGTQAVGPGNASSAGPNAPPSAPAPAAQAAVAAIIGTLAAANVPINTPVVVAASANAAAAQAAANADPGNAALQQAAATALNEAVQAAQQALAAAVAAGAVLPTPPAPQQQQQQQQEGTTSPTGTTSTPTGGAGAGGGGGGSTASPN